MSLDDVGSGIEKAGKKVGHVGAHVGEGIWHGMKGLVHHDKDPFHRPPTAADRYLPPLGIGNPEESDGASRPVLKIRGQETPDEGQTPAKPGQPKPRETPKVNEAHDAAALAGHTAAKHPLHYEGITTDSHTHKMKVAGTDVPVIDDGNGHRHAVLKGHDDVPATRIDFDSHGHITATQGNHTVPLEMHRGHLEGAKGGVTLGQDGRFLVAGTHLEAHIYNKGGWLANTEPGHAVYVHNDGTGRVNLDSGGTATLTARNGHLETAGGTKLGDSGLAASGSDKVREVAAKAPPVGEPLPGFELVPDGATKKNLLEKFMDDDTLQPRNNHDLIRMLAEVKLAQSNPAAYKEYAKEMGALYKYDVAVKEPLPFESAPIRPSTPLVDAMERQIRQTEETLSKSIKPGKDATAVTRDYLARSGYNPDEFLKAPLHDKYGTAWSA